MEKERLIEKLTRLAQLEVDAEHTYRLVADKIDDSVIRQRLAQFHDEHRKHIQSIASEVEALGAPPPDLSPDIKGYLIEGVTALMSSAGLSGALQGLKLNEELTTGSYQEALKWETPPAIRRLIKSHFTEEKIHLDYIASNLKAIKAS